MKYTITMELKDIPGIGDKTISALKRAGITDVSTLLTNFPRTYRTYRASSVNEAQIGDWVILRGTISRVNSHRTFRTTTQTANFWDLSGSLTLRWFNMPYIVRSLSPDSQYLVKGVISEFNGRRQIISPQLSKTSIDDVFTDQVVPIYSAKGGIKPWIFRQKISQTIAAIDPLPDPLPDSIVSKYNLLPYYKAISRLHVPHSESDLTDAVRRISFQELFNLQVKSLRLKEGIKSPGLILKVDKNLVEDYLNSLPFEPTLSQINAIDEIIIDLQQPYSMHRLLQGEVGSGKTVVAISSAIAAYSAGYRTIVLAPTQILAIQLYENFSKACENMGISVTLVTSKTKGVSDSDVIIGTQAILNLENLENIGLVIVDEQHRFGVEQREKLAKGKLPPHLLQMTATPIPRSMAQTVFHHMDITRLTDIPKNRLPVKTFLVPEIKRRDSYDWIRTEILSKQNQTFIVVPLIEAAEENDTAPLKSLKELEMQLKKTFSDLNVDIMHGKMKEDEKIDHMTRFKKGMTQVLVATSMIEVGIDIPEANIMVIEDAERFGLAQLHQLRGRVGRGGKQGYCLLFSNAKSSKAKERLAFFIRELNGEKLARYDLETRGPGELFGTLQSGFFNLSLGSMYDEKLLSETYEAAKSTLRLD